MTQIKICGITREEDAQRAAGLGADYLGFIFAAESPRHVSAERAAAIVASLPVDARPKIVGVFRDAPVETVRSVARRVALDFVQLHGNESSDVIDALDIPVIKAVRVGATLPDTSIQGEASWLLFDTLDERAAGGTGRTFDWALLDPYDRSRPFFLAGGINPDNVAEAIARVRPSAVDVSSGVESAPGVKDATKLQSLFERARKS